MNHHEQEFEQVMRTHKATIYTVCYMFSKDQDEVADLFQECLINLWRSWPNFEGRSDVRTWIYRNTLHENEVDNLRQQLAQFKQRLNQQEIISDRLMRHSMNARISIFTKSSVIFDAIGLLSMPFILLALYKIGVSWYLGLILLMAVIVEFVYNIICHRKLQRLFTDGNDLLTVRRGLLKFRRAELIQMLIAVPSILLWMLVLYWQIGIFGNELTSASTKGLVASAVGIFFGLIICFGFFFCEMRRVNQSVREIDEYDQTTPDPS